MKFFCGQRTSSGWACGKEAVWLLNRSDFSLKEGWRVKDSMYCKTHRGGALRRVYNAYDADDFLDIHSDAAKPALDIHAAYSKQQDEERSARDKDQREQRIANLKQSNPAAWAEYDKPVRVKELFLQNDGYAKNRNEHKWTIVRTRGFDYDVEVEYLTLDDEAEWYQIDPVYIRVPQTSTLTPIEAREYAAMILQAADAADIETDTRRRRRERLMEKES